MFVSLAIWPTASKLHGFGRYFLQAKVVKPQVGFGVFADPDQPRTAV